MYKETQVKNYIEQRDLITETNKLNQENPFQEAKRKSLSLRSMGLVLFLKIKTNSPLSGTTLDLGFGF